MSNRVTYRNRKVGDHIVREKIWNRRVQSRLVFHGSDLIGTLFHLDQGPRKGWYESPGTTSAEYLGGTMKVAVQELQDRFDRKGTP